MLPVFRVVSFQGGEPQFTGAVVVPSWIPLDGIVGPVFQPILANPWLFTNQEQFLVPNQSFVPNLPLAGLPQNQVTWVQDVGPIPDSWNTGHAVVLANDVDIPTTAYSWATFSDASSGGCPTSESDSSGIFHSGTSDCSITDEYLRLSISSCNSYASAMTSQPSITDTHSNCTDPRSRNMKRTKREQMRMENAKSNEKPRIVDLATTFTMNGEELPYVVNIWDPNRPLKFAKTPSNMEYYVPPAVDDSDFFGGQQHMWQIKMIEYFGRFPDVWRIQAVPDFKKNPDEGWLGFHITTKLRFCCRSCNTPWTSKQGKIVFGMRKHFPHGGLIFMKMFGQKCMKKQRKVCNDWTYQQPACYPEEIERTVHKLAEYVGHLYYRLPMPSTIYEDCKKSIRLANTNGTSNINAIGDENHHRKDLCQACHLGVCRQVVVN